MLVLGRKKHEVVVVTHRGERLDVMVMDIRREGRDPSAKLGFDGPPTFVIKREEIFEGPEQPYESR